MLYAEDAVAFLDVVLPEHVEQFAFPRASRAGDTASGATVSLAAGLVRLLLVTP
jgi:hypothetical protein